MVKKIIQLFLFCLLVLVIALWQISFISAWSDFWGQLNLILMLLIFILFFFGQRPAFLAAFLSGFCLDVFSFNFFGLYFISLSLIIWLAQKLLINLFTNRSLYSFLLLSLATTVSYSLLINFLLYFSAAERISLFLIRSNFWRDLAYQSIWSVLGAILLFNIVAVVTKKFKPFFLEKKPVL